MQISAPMLRWISIDVAIQFWEIGLFLQIFFVQGNLNFYFAVLSRKMYQTFHPLCVNDKIPKIMFVKIQNLRIFYFLLHFLSWHLINELYILKIQNFLYCWNTLLIKISIHSTTLIYYFFPLLNNTFKIFFPNIIKHKVTNFSHFILCVNDKTP